MKLTRRTLISGLAVSMLHGLRASAHQASVPGVPEPISEIAAADNDLYAVTATALWIAGDAAAAQLIVTAGLRLPVARGKSVYCVDPGGRVLCATKSPRAPKVVADAHRAVFDMALDETHVYVACSDARRPLEGGSSPTQPGVVLRAPLAGGAFEKLTEHGSQFPLLALDGDRVYLASDDGIAFVAKTGSSLQVVLASKNANQRTTAVLPHEQRLYVLTQNELREVDRATGATRALLEAPLLMDLAARGEWIYVVRNSVAGKPPKPGALLAVSTKTGSVRTLIERLQFPQVVQLGRDRAWVLESAVMASRPGSAQLKQVSLS